MKLYKFGYNFWTNEVDVREIEVTEKDKCYVGASVRVLKSEINTLSRYNSMYCLENNPSVFLDALLRQKEIELECGLRAVERRKEELENIKKFKKENE